MSDRERLLELERQVAQMQVALDRLAVNETTSMPYRQTRLGVTTKGPLGSYPSTGSTFYVDFKDGTYSVGSGPTFVDRGTQAMCCNMLGTLPDEGETVECFEWDGKWWTKYNTITGGGGGSLQCAVLNWSDTLTNPNQVIAPGGTAEVIVWDASNEQSSGTGMTFSAANNSMTYDPGTYLIIAECAIGSEDTWLEYPGGHARGGKTYIDTDPDHVVPGDVTQCGNVRVTMETFATGSWVLIPWHGGYAAPNQNSHDDAQLIMCYNVPNGPAEELRMKVHNDTSDSADSGIDVFHARWLSLRIGV